MSVVVGRIFVAIAAIALLASVGWLWLAAAGPDSRRAVTVLPASTVLPAITVLPAVMALLAAVALLVGVPLFGRFGEAAIERDAPVIRSVLRPRRTIALAEVADVLVIESLVLPARTSKSVRRLVIRTRAGRVVAVTPRDGHVLDQLRALPVSLTVESETLTPAQAARRYPASASLPERTVGAMLWVAVIAPVIVVAWILLTH
ncbi:hypothetical protein [Microbacterium sp. ZW T5_56]|uniref:hypothetical protein n=1 Tax=Microbacterium sp. ZW T5_56 TaxID=3378081 RepID=UPI003851EA00